MFGKTTPKIRTAYMQTGNVTLLQLISIIWAKINQISLLDFGEQKPGWC